MNPTHLRVTEDMPKRYGLVRGDILEFIDICSDDSWDVDKVRSSPDFISHWVVTAKLGDRELHSVPLRFTEDYVMTKTNLRYKP